MGRRKPRRPWFILVGGINGAGKTTFAQSPASFEALQWSAGVNLEIINPDLVTRALRDANPKLNLSEANVEAANFCERRVHDIIKEGTRSFAIETVLSTDKYKSIVKAALARRYQVQFIYVLVGSVEEAIARVKHRVSKQHGHDVPEKKIRKRWGPSLANVSWFWENSTGAWIFFNGDRVKETQLVAYRDDKGTTFYPEALSLLLPGDGLVITKG